MPGVTVPTPERNAFKHLVGMYNNPALPASARHRVPAISECMAFFRRFRRHARVFLHARAAVPGACAVFPTWKHFSGPVDRSRLLRFTVNFSRCLSCPSGSVDSRSAVTVFYLRTCNFSRPCRLARRIMWAPKPRAPSRIENLATGPENETVATLNPRWNRVFGRASSFCLGAPKFKTPFKKLFIDCGEGF